MTSCWWPWDAPNVEGLNLEAAGVAYDVKAGIRVDDYLRTTNARIFAAGDVCSQYKFTHAADFMARIVIRNALFKGRAKASTLVIPWCTYTSPEIAHVGLYPKEAEARGIAIDTYTQELSGVDRAILEGETEGFVRIHTKRGTDRIVGATIVAANAGDMISEITLAMTHDPGRTVEGIEFRSMTIVAHKGKQGPCRERKQAVVYRGPFKKRWRTTTITSTTVANGWPCATRRFVSSSSNPTPASSSSSSRARRSRWRRPSGLIAAGPNTVIRGNRRAGMMTPPRRLGAPAPRAATAAKRRKVVRRNPSPKHPTILQESSHGGHYVTQRRQPTC